MRISEEEYNKCWISPYQQRFLKTIQEKIPAFAKFNDEKLTKKKVFQWVVMMYDPNSPWLYEESNYYNRKRETALEVGFELTGGYFEDYVEDMLIGKNSNVNDLKASYIVRFSMPEYTQLISLLDLQFHINKDLSKGNYDSTTTKTLNSVTLDINKLTSLLFGSGEHDEILEVRKALYKEAEYARVKLNPENIVKILNEEGELPKDFSPYGDYKPEQSKFISDEGEADAEEITKL